MFGKPASSHKRQTWITPGQLRQDDPRTNTSTMFSVEENRITVLDHDDRTYFRLESEDVQRMGELGTAVLAQMGEGVDGAPPSQGLRSTGRLREVSGWECEEYQIDDRPLPGSRVTLCVSKQVGIDAKLRRQFSQAAFGVSGTAVDGLLKQLGDLDGYPVELEVSVDYGGRPLVTTQRLLKVEEVEVDDAMFSVPADYTRVENPLAALTEGLAAGENKP
jgi:hypothetical protein